jgi:L-alanine-DL-glutamate epimerase-like enolase superfamily enzyme
MKITEIVAHPLSFPYAQPRWTAHEVMDKAQMVLVEVRTDAGLVGIGEIAGGPQSVICDLVAKFSDVIKGKDPLGHTGIWEKLFSLTSPRPGGIGGWDGMPAPLPRGQRPQIMAAIGGIDIALWDIKGKAAGLPVFRLLGGTRTEVFTYSTGGYYLQDAPLGGEAEEFAGFVAKGFRAVKMKTGALSLKDEVTRVRSVREAIGPGVLFMLDMNAPYDVDGCIAFANAVGPIRHLLAGGTAALVFAAGRLSAPRGGVANSAGARGTRMASVYDSGFSRFGSDPFRAIRFNPACRVH